VLNSNPSLSRPLSRFLGKKKEEINDFRKTEMNKGSGEERLQRKMDKGNTERRTLQ
jgi:hypothetical protein